MKFFSGDNPVFNFISRIGDMMLLSLLWFVTSLPVITIGASTTSLYYCCTKMIRRRDSSVIRDYFSAFRSNFRQSTVIFLIMAAAGATVAADMYFWAHSESEISVFMNAVSIGIAVIYAAELLYVFPVQAVFENTIKATMRTAFLMALKHWKNTIVLLAATAALAYLCWLIDAVMYIFLIFGTGIFGMIYSVRFIDVFRCHNEVIADDMRGNTGKDDDDAPPADNTDNRSQ